MDSSKSTEDAKFKQWLLTRGVGLTVIKGDTKWNAATIEATARHILKDTKK